MKRVSPRRFFRIVLWGGAACCATVLAVWFFLLHPPWFLNRLGSTLGYGVSARAVSLSPGLSGSISGLRIEKKKDGLTLLAGSVTAENSLPGVLRGRIGTLVLRNPRLTLRGGGKEGGESGLSFLGKLPPVGRLEVRNGEARFAFRGGRQELRLTHVDLTWRALSPRTGGEATFRADVSLTSAAGEGITASGRISGNLQLAALYPRPYGRGTVELVLDSGRYTAGGRSVSLDGLTLSADWRYDRGTETFAVTALRGRSKSFGIIQGAGQAVLRGANPWSADLSLTAMDFAQLFGLLRPLLPASYRQWTLQGRGAVETRLRGTYGDEHLFFHGDASLSFQGGGFSSPDGTKAAQNLTGRMVLKLQYGPPEGKLTFDVDSEQDSGEYLWGDYYGDFSGEKAALTAQGSLSLDPARRFRVKGSLDLFQTGVYSFRGSGKESDWTLGLKATDVSHEKLVDRLLRGYLRELSPDLEGLSVTGTSSLEARIRHRSSGTEISGTYRMSGTTLKVPRLQLLVQRLGADLPFDLRYPLTVREESPAAAAGFVRFQTMRRKKLVLGGLRIPVILAADRLEVPEPVRVPFYGGEIMVYGVQVDDVLSPRRYRFGVKIEHVDLGRLTRSLTGTAFAGTISADLGLMTYRDHRLASEGRARVDVFGGRIEVANLFVENIGSPLMRMGGDLTFTNISLEDVTRKIPVGKMTGIIRGSLKDFVLEDGQPASFVLEVESVPRSGVEQRISMDAIQSISILGTGAGGALNRGLASLFKEFSYARIGFRCVLKNDNFSVRGTIHEGGKEYLVRRGFFGGVDVVNQNPDNVISFRDMEERIRRIYEKSANGSDAIEVK